MDKLNEDGSQARRGVGGGDDGGEIGFKTGDNGFPALGLDREAGEGAEANAEVGIGGEVDARGDEFFGLVAGDAEAVFAGADELARGGVVEAGNGEAAGHGFGEDVAKRFREAGVDIDVGRGVVAGEIVAGDEAGKNPPGKLALERGAERAVADEDAAQAGFGGAHGREGAEKERIVFLGGHAAGVDHDGIGRRGAPRSAQGEGAQGGAELGGVNAAREDGEIAEAELGEFGAELAGRREGAARAVVNVAEPRERDALERADAVVAGIGVEVGVKAGGDGEAEGAGGGDGGGAERTFRGDVDEIGAIRAPALAQRAAGREAETEHGITGERETGQGDDLVFGMSVGGREIVAAGAIDGDLMATPAEFAGDHAKRHRDAVDFRREGFGDEGEFHKMRGGGVVGRNEAL